MHKRLIAFRICFRTFTDARHRNLFVSPGGFTLVLTKPFAEPACIVITLVSLNVSLVFCILFVAILTKISTGGIRNNFNSAPVSKRIGVTLVLSHYFDDDCLQFSDDVSLNKTKNRITWLNELRPGSVYQVAAQYGSNENSMFVMEVEIDGKVRH